jgi:protein TonB
MTLPGPDAAPLPTVPRDSAGKWVAVSVAAHLGLVVVAFLSNRDTGPKIDLSAKPIVAKLVKLGQKRDEAMLPRMAPNTPPPAPSAPSDKAVPSPTKPAEPKPKTPAPQKDLTKDLFAGFDKTKPTTAAEPAVGDPNGDKEGTEDHASEGERYYGLLSSRVKRNYDVSSAIPDTERLHLVAKVVLYVDASGNVTKVDFTAKSGNDLFDSAVESAVKKASPFPPPPDFLRAALAKDGVELKFRP